MLANDHRYDKFCPENNILNHLGLYKITKSCQDRLKEDTMSQHTNKIWHDERRMRLTSSQFQKICRVENDNQKRNVAQSILCHKKFWSKATTHGKMYESVAKENFEEKFLENQKVEKMWASHHAASSIH